MNRYLYLKGRYFWSKRTADALKKGIEYFEQAIGLDPKYALAYSGLADSYTTLRISTPQLSPGEYFQKAKEAALKAVELDDTLAEAHTSLGAVKEWFEWDWAAAEREYKRALELDPGYATAHHRYGIYLAYMRRFDEAVAEIKQAQQLEPLSLAINTDLGFVYYLMRQYDQAIEQLQKALEIDPSYPRAHGLLSNSYAAKHMYDEAIAEAQKASPLPGAPGLKALSGVFYAKQGRRAEALKILAELEEMSKQHNVPPFLMVRLYAALGYKDQAFAWIQKMYEVRNPNMRNLTIDPNLDELRSDPRVVELLRRAGFPQ